MHDGRGNQCRPNQNNKASDQSSALGVERVEQRTHARRVAGDLEKAKYSQYQQNSQVGRQEKGEPERQHRKQIDDPQRAGCELEPGLAPRQVSMWWMLDRNPQTEAIFKT